MLQDDYLMRLIRRALQMLLQSRAARREAGIAAARDALSREARRLVGLDLGMLTGLRGPTLEAVLAPTGALDPARTVAVALMVAEAGTLAELEGDGARGDRLRERALALWSRLWQAREAGATTAPVVLEDAVLDEVVALTASVRCARLAVADRVALVGLLATAGAVEAVEDELFALVDEGRLDRPAARALLRQLAAAARPEDQAAVAALQAELVAAPGSP